MYKYLLILLSVLLISCTTVPTGLSPSQFFQSVAKVNIGDFSSGSAVVIKKEDNTAFLLTNEHVASNPDITYTVQFPVDYNVKIPAQIVDTNSYYDIALFKITTDLNLLPSKLCTTETKIFDKVVAVGAGAGLFPFVTEGIVSNPYTKIPVYQPYVHPYFLQHTATIAPGNSGGGLYRIEGDKYCLEGLNVRSGNNLHFAVARKHIEYFLKVYLNAEER